MDSDLLFPSASPTPQLRSKSPSHRKAPRPATVFKPDKLSPNLEQKVRTAVQAALVFLEEQEPDSIAQVRGQTPCCETIS